MHFASKRLDDCSPRVQGVRGLLLHSLLAEAGVQDVHEKPSSDNCIFTSTQKQASTMLREHKRCDCLHKHKANKYLKGLMACQTSVSLWWPQTTDGCNEIMNNSHTDRRQKAVEFRLTQPDAMYACQAHNNQFINVC